jgi:hypothetical protein
MKRFVPLVVLGMVMAAGAGALAVQQDRPTQAKPDKTAAPDVTGKWMMTVDTSMGTGNPDLELIQAGEKITGTYTGRYGALSLQGTLKGLTIQFFFTMGAEAPQIISFAGEVAADGQSMKGTASLGEMGDATWSAKRQ